MWGILLANFNPSTVTCIFACGGSSDHAENRPEGTLTESGSTNGTPKVEWSASIEKEYAGQDLERRKKKVVGKPYEGEPHVRFEVAETGDGLIEYRARLRPYRTPPVLPAARGMGRGCGNACVPGARQ